ncbi:MAG: ABC transporter ATP-binding protein [Acidimicrobiales bacterium]
MGAAAELVGVTKVYGNGAKAVDDLDLAVDDGELLVLVGPSGCGKTTLLRMLAGLEDITSGTLRIGGRVVNNVLPRDRDVAMVFQNYALYPHLTVARNIGFGLRLRKVAKREIELKVVEAARILGLEEYLDRKPAQLSGGQRQRVAMGRAIVRDPALFLLDEPLSNLDAKLRVQMRAEIRRIQRRLGVATVYVTHDQVEAMTLGDRVAVLDRGTLQQVAPPDELYDRPANVFVAAFTGSPAMNFYEGTYEVSADGATWAVLGHQRLRVGPTVVAARPGLRLFVGKPVIVGIRPEDLDDAGLSPDHPADARLRAEVDVIESLGSELLVHFRIDAPKAGDREVRAVRAAASGATASPGAATAAGGRPAGSVTEEVADTGTARFDRRSRVREADVVEMTVDTSRLHFFEAATGDAIYGAPGGQGGPVDERPPVAVPSNW